MSSNWLLYIFASLVLILQATGSKEIHLDPKSGINDASCGTISKPCKALDFAWNQFLSSSTSNTTSNVTFLLQPGVYNTDQVNAQPLFYRCSNESVSKIDIRRNKQIKNTTESSVRIFLSFSVSQCYFKLTGLMLKDYANLTATDASIHIDRCVIRNTKSSFNFIRTNTIFNDVIFSSLSSANQILVLRSNAFTIQNSIFEYFKLSDPTKPFIDIQSIEALTLTNISMRQCDAIYEAPITLSKFLSVKEANKLQLKNISISQNHRLGFQINNVPLVTVDHLNIDDNVNITLSFENVKANVTRVILKSRFVDGGRPTMSFMKSNVEFKELVVSCNSKKMLEQSPISVDSLTTAKCSNCSILNCKNLCGAGFQMTQNVFCEKCPAGTSARTWEKTCRSCYPGFHSPKSGAVDCHPCSAGSYCDEKGCTSCHNCKNEMFTSTNASASCSQMSLLFIILLGVSLLLIMAPIAVKVIKTKTQSSEQKNEESDELEDEPNQNQKYKKFENEETVG